MEMLQGKNALLRRAIIEWIMTDNAHHVFLMYQGQIKTCSVVFCYEPSFYCVLTALILLQT